MENDMTTMTAEPVVAHQLTSYKDVARTCPQSRLIPRKILLTESNF